MCWAICVLEKATEKPPQPALPSTVALPARGSRRCAPSQQHGAYTSVIDLILLVLDTSSVSIRSAAEHSSWALQLKCPCMRGLRAAQRPGLPARAHRGSASPCGGSSNAGTALPRSSGRLLTANNRGTAPGSCPALSPARFKAPRKGDEASCFPCTNVRAGSHPLVPLWAGY